MILRMLSGLVALTLMSLDLCVPVINHRTGDSDHCNKTVDIHQAVSSPPVTELNRGRPLHCSYKIRVRPVRDDWVVFVRFTRMHVGQPNQDRSQCIGGYVQIVDGYKDSNYSNRDSPGFYCGDIDSPKTFISETPQVKIIFHADSYGSDTVLQFTPYVEKQGEVPERYGQFPHLYPHRRGAPVPGSYCDRTFQECAPGRCFVQSPGFPGIYPRNLRCRYRVSVRQYLVGLDLTAFDVDGLRCDNMLLCFPRPIVRDAGQCPYDIVRIYDGPSLESPLIISLCGRGRLKSNIIASGPDILVEFVTSNSGPLLNTGFHFKADSIIDPDSSEPLQLRNNSCFVERYLPENKESTFSNLRSWYPPNTTCAYRFHTTSEDVIRLDFLLFRIERFTKCAESLKLYDAPEPNPTKIITKICDENKAQAMYESTGHYLYVEFVSSIGSLDGSSISYEFQVKSVGASSLESGHACSRVLDRDGQINLPLHELNATSQPMTCNYTLDASSLLHGRINLTLDVPFEKMTKFCSECKQEAIVLEISGASIDDSPLCMCHLSRKRSISIISMSSVMVITLRSNLVPGESKVLLTPSTSSKNTNSKDITGYFVFFSDVRCGPEVLKLDLQGSITFPSFQENYLPGTIHCLWHIPLLPGMDAGFRLENFIGNNCSSDYLKVNHVLLCPAVSEHSFVVQREDIKSSTVVLDLRATEAAEINFTLWWTQLRVLPAPSTATDYSLMSFGKECEFLCAASLTCIRKELVCNGVPNCPRSKDAPLKRYSPDEEPSMCNAGKNSFQFQWWVIGFGLGICVCVIFGVAYTVGKRCQSYRARQRF
ncbi:cubilin-like [Uloborus diversus]|uniref:cubilin-like n=1 Tax=Uloborus diversus TaxID=327109 RepID=UPI0024097EEE|nr:cubilin-like [Uloborus diversus]